MSSQEPRDATKAKLQRLLFRSVPGVLPWVGGLWKDIVDEFSDDEVRAALGRLEGLAQTDAQGQAELLLEVLNLKGLVSGSHGILHRMELREEALSLLRWLLENDWGNSRFLYALARSPEGQRLAQDADLEFRKSYPAYLDSWVGELTPGESFPFTVMTTAQAVAFPEGFNSYSGLFRNPALEPSDIPRLIQGGRVSADGDDVFMEGVQAVDLPDLPLCSGYIHDVDSATGLPVDVRDVPCDRRWNAFYWVRPTGLRLGVFGLGVVDPLESRFGISLWWDHADSRPFFRVGIVEEQTPEVRARNRDSAVKAYGRLLRRHAHTRAKSRPEGDG